MSPRRPHHRAGPLRARTRRSMEGPTPGRCRRSPPGSPPDQGLARHALGACAARVQICPCQRAQR
eukprot:11203734-Lingulodinium_polyedra.AAC.1